MGLSELIPAPIHQSIPTTAQIGHENLQTKLTAEQEQFVPFSSWLQELEWLDDFVVSVTMTLGDLQH